MSKSLKNRRFGPKTQRVAVKIWSLMTVVAEKLAFKDDGVHYLAKDSKKRETVPYAQFLQAVKHEGVYLITLKVKCSTSEFNAIAITPFKNEHLVKCTRENAPEVVINVASLVKVPN